MGTYTSSEFPNSFLEPFELTSPSSGEYNCIAWALKDLSRFIWPLRQRGFYWPKGVPMEESVDAFINLFARYGFQICENGSHEQGYEKLALFAKEGVPTHAARQLADGMWTSKLVGYVDVKHKLAAMEGGRYGDVILFFKPV
jgi:hypothetical protein